jgi:hypothetical protein
MIDYTKLNSSQKKLIKALIKNPNGITSLAVRPTYSDHKKMIDKKMIKIYERIGKETGLYD